MKYVGTNDLIWQGDETIKVFPSGLVVAQRTAVLERGSFRLAPKLGDLMPLRNNPTIDGLYIYPEPDERRTPAFIFYNVTAYGRCNTTGQRKEIEYPVGNFMLQGFYKSFCVLENEKVNPLDFQPPVSPVLIHPRGGILILSSFFCIAKDFSRVNYGKIDEVAFTLEFNGTVLSQ